MYERRGIADRGRDIDSSTMNEEERGGAR